MRYSRRPERRRGAFSPRERRRDSPRIDASRRVRSTWSARGGRPGCCVRRRPSGPGRRPRRRSMEPEPPHPGERQHRRGSAVPQAGGGGGQRQGKEHVLHGSLPPRPEGRTGRQRCGRRGFERRCRTPLVAGLVPGLQRHRRAENEQEREEQRADPAQQELRHLIHGRYRRSGTAGGQREEAWRLLPAPRRQKPAPAAPPGVAGAGFGASATRASVVMRREATDAASCSAVRTTLAGSITPAWTRSWYSPVAAL